MKIAASRKFPWRLKEIELLEVEPSLAEIAGATFPFLRKLCIVAEDPRIPTELWRCPVFQRLHELDFKTPGAISVAEFLNHGVELNELRSFKLQQPGVALHGERVGSQFTLRFELDAAKVWDEPDLTGLSKVKRTRIASVTINGAPRAALTRRVSAAVRHLPHEVRSARSSSR